MTLAAILLFILAGLVTVWIESRYGPLAHSSAKKGR